jgi:CheY-like chemotaxis protein
LTIPAHLAGSFVNSGPAILLRFVDSTPGLVEEPTNFPRILVVAANPKYVESRGRWASILHAVGGMGDPLTILVVEDDIETADLLRGILNLCGYHVVAAFDGLDALEMLHRGLRPAAIVLDLTMPNMDGRRFYAALLADPTLALIPVVVHSADPGTDPLPGIVGHVRKGFDNPDVLLALIDVACGGGRGRGKRGRKPNGPGS